MSEDFDSIDASILSDDDLDSVSGGALPPNQKEKAKKSQDPEYEKKEKAPPPAPGHKLP